MNYAHPLAFDIYPTGPFLFSLKLYFFQLCIPLLLLLLFLNLSLEKMTGQNPLVQISVWLNSLLREAGGCYTADTGLTDVRPARWRGTIRPTWPRISAHSRTGVNSRRICNTRLRQVLAHICACAASPIQTGRGCRNSCRPECNLTSDWKLNSSELKGALCSFIYLFLLEQKFNISTIRMR